MGLVGTSTAAVTGRIHGLVRGRIQGVRVLAPAMVGVFLLAACGAAPPPAGDGSGVPTAPDASGLVEGSPTVTVSGTTVQLLGLGTGTTPEFDLPAGNAEMTVSPCPSNQVIPFVTLFDGNNKNLGLIVDPVYLLKNLAGGKYYLTVQANPNCVWTIALTPKQ